MSLAFGDASGAAEGSGDDDPDPHPEPTPMYGVGGFDDSARVRDYDPWEHAAVLGIPIVFRDDLPDPAMVACYSDEHAAIFVRPGLHGAVERCAIAHEIVHFEHGDVGSDDLQEERADRIAARRLIRPRRLDRLARVTDDPAVVALELHVTERVMRTHVRMLRQGRLRHPDLATARAGHFPATVHDE